MFHGVKFSTVNPVSCYFNTLRREDLLGIAMSRNLRIRQLYSFTVCRSGKTYGADNT